MYGPGAVMANCSTFDLARSRFCAAPLHKYVPSSRILKISMGSSMGPGPLRTSLLWLEVHSSIYSNADQEKFRANEKKILRHLRLIGCGFVHHRASSEATRRA